MERNVRKPPIEGGTRVTTRERGGEYGFLGDERLFLRVFVVTFFTARCGTFSVVALLHTGLVVSACDVCV